MQDLLPPDEDRGENEQEKAPDPFLKQESKEQLAEGLLVIDGWSPFTPKVQAGESAS